MATPTLLRHACMPALREAALARPAGAAAAARASGKARHLSPASARPRMAHEGARRVAVAPSRFDYGLCKVGESSRSSYAPPTKRFFSSSSSQRVSFIQTETTPNTDSLKFIPGTPVSTSGTHEFLDAKSAAASPLADRLFDLPGVKTVFFGPDFISVNKDGDSQWSDLKPDIYSVIMEHFTTGTPLFREGSSSDGPEDTRILDTDSEVVAMIKELLDTRVRPAIQEDGGDIEYKGFDEETGVVQLSLKGSCRGCDSSTVTLKSGIERMLMHYIPEVKTVEQILGKEEAVAIDEFAKFEERLRSQGKTVEL